MANGINDTLYDCDMSDIPEGMEPQKLLVEGVRAGRKGWVDAALTCGASVNIKLSKDDPIVSRGSLLCLAAAMGHAHLVPVLVDAGVHVDDRGGFGYTPLQVAVHLGHDDVFDALMKAQPNSPDVNARDEDGVNSLHLAARKDREYCAKALIAAGADLNARDKSNRTPLHVSVFGKTTKIMELLLDAGCDPQALNSQGFTVLHTAALCGNEKAIQVLRMAGLEANGQDNMGLTPEEVADTWGSHGTAWLLSKMPKAARAPSLKVTPASSYTKLQTSWEEYEKEGQKTFKWVKERKAYLFEANSPVNRDPHYQDEAGNTAMHCAAQLGLDSTALALTKSFCSYPGVVNYAGDTPAQLAERAGYTELAKELSAMTTVEENSSPIELYWKLLITISVKDDVGEAVKLMNSGSPLLATYDLHTNALVLAITCNRPRIVTLLAAAGAPLSTISGGLSLLQVAWLTPDVTTRVRVLVTRIFRNVLQVEQDRVRPEDSVLRDGMDHLLNSLRGETPWQTAWPFRDKAYSDLTSLLVAAARNNCPLTATFLKLCGGMSFKRDDQGTTPLHAALDANHMDMARMLVRDLGACLYAEDSKGKLPLELLQHDVRQQLEEEVYQREKRQIENYQEKAKDQEDKKHFQDVLEVLETLFAKHLGLSSDTPGEVLMTQALLVASRRGMHLLTYLVIKVGGLPISTVVDPTQDSTALHQAASHGHSVCVALLLSLGACVLKPDRYGHTPAHLAAMFCHKLTYRLLIKHMAQHDPKSRAGRTHKEVAQSFKAYLKSYDKMKALDPQKSIRFNDSSIAIKELLTEGDIRRKMKKLKKVLVDFNQGEAREVKEAVLKEVEALVADVATQNNLYDGRLVLVGSSADGTRLYAPDEFDINLVVSGIEDIEVAVEDLARHEALLKGHTLKAGVRTKHLGLQGIAFKSNLYQLMSGCLATHHICDDRLSYVPPGLERTQAGVALNFAWQGETYPLLLVSVDVVPVLGVPWPDRLQRPPLTPDSLSEVFLTNTAEDEWRFSLAGAEAEVLNSLASEDRLVYASCKLVLSYLKAERWMPKPIKDSYCWWDSRKWRITAPAGFGVKNCFLRQLELKRAGKLNWPKNRLAGVAAILRGMCEDFKDPSYDQESLVPAKIHAYFGGEFEKPKLGEGAPDIIRVLEGKK